MSGGMNIEHADLVEEHIFNNQFKEQNSFSKEKENLLKKESTEFSKIIKDEFHPRLKDRAS